LQDQPENRFASIESVIDILNEKLRDAANAEESFVSIAEVLREFADADIAALAVIDEDGQHLKMVGAAGLSGIKHQDWANYRVRASLLQVFSEKKSSSVVRFSSPEELSDDARPIAVALKLQSMLLCSMVLKGELVGLLMVGRQAGRPTFVNDIERPLSRLSDYLALAAESIRTDFRMRQRQEETLRLLSIAPIGIMSLDTKGIIKSANQQVLSLLEMKREEDLVGTSIFEIPAVHKSGMDALVLQGMEGHGAEKVDLHYVPRPEKAYYLHVKVAPILSEKRDVHGVVLVAMDTTSKVRLESQLERSYEKLTQTYQELERVDRMKSQFIDVVSHELRTPLTVMRGYVDLVESDYSPKLDAKFGQKLKIIKTNTDKLYALVESMLDVSRLEKGTLEVRPEPVKLDTILEEIVEGRTKDAEQKKQTMTLTVDGQMPIMMLDRRRIRDVFNNLIDNAVKYTEEGGKVQVGARDEGKIVHIWVKDNGVGIPLENLGKIFDRFYIVAKDDLAHQVDRIGLSLPISKGIVEAHGGRLWVESQVGRGSVFHVDLPKENPKVP